MTRWVTTLIVANIAVFLLTLSNPILVREFGFLPVEILERPWTLVTYMFLHGGWSHLLFNMIGLFFFGPPLESFLGEKKFLWLYGLSGLAAAMVSSMFSPFTLIIGASGAVYGVFLGFAYFWPKQVIHIWGVFPIQARWLIVGMTVFSVFSGLGGAQDGVAHFAHLGGFLGAWLYLRWAVNKLGKKAVRPEGVKVSQSDIERWRAIDRNRLHEVNREELDRIQKKLVGEGGSMLTPSEKAFLDRFSEG